MLLFTNLRSCYNNVSKINIIFIVNFNVYILSVTKIYDKYDMYAIVLYQVIAHRYYQQLKFFVIKHKNIIFITIFIFKTSLK